MKTHQFAKALRTLASVLQSGPDIDLKELTLSKSGVQSSLPGEDLSIALSTLASLSRIDKKQWASLIIDYNFPIEIRPRDASRDILGKLLRHLETNPAAFHTLRESAKQSSGKTSSALKRAFEVLLREL